MRLASLLGVLLCAHAAAQPSDDAEIASWVARLDEAPDPLHADYTPAVHALCALGLRGASAILAPLDAADEMTRLRAQRVLDCAVSRHFGFVPGRGFADNPGGDARARALWHENGAYDFRADRSARLASIARWRAWLGQHASRPAPLPDTLSPSTLRDGLAEVEPRMRACLPAGTNVAVSITFAGSGVVRRVRLPSPIERTTEGRCLREAARAARVRPFARPSQSVSVGVRGNGQTPTR